MELSKVREVFQVGQVSEWTVKPPQAASPGRRGTWVAISIALLLAGSGAARGSLAGGEVSGM